MISLYKQTIFPGATIGIIGGGQLGKMMAVAAKQMGYKIAVVDPVPSSPCGQVADLEITAAYNDREAIRKLAEASDVITYEFENIDYDALNWLKEHAYLPQGSELLLLTQNRETEKKAIASAGCKVAPYRIIHDRAELEASVAELGLPAVLKTCRGGYDGKGQYVPCTNRGSRSSFTARHMYFGKLGSFQNGIVRDRDKIGSRRDNRLSGGRKHS